MNRDSCQPSFSCVGERKKERKVEKKKKKEETAYSTINLQTSDDYISKNKTTFSHKNVFIP